jgi:hypothetical protein
MAGVVTTTTINKRSVFGDRKVVNATLAYDTGDYAAGGIAVTAAQFGLTVIEAVLFQGAALDVSATPTALMPQWNHGDLKVRLFEAAAAGASFTEKPAEAMGAGASVRVLVIGY